MAFSKISPISIRIRQRPPRGLSGVLCEVVVLFILFVFSLVCSDVKPEGLAWQPGNLVTASDIETPLDFVPKRKGSTSAVDGKTVTSSLTSTIQKFQDII